MANRKIRILHISNNTNFGGQQQVFMDIIRNINKDKYQIDLAVYDDSGAYSNEIKEYGCNIYTIPSITKHLFKHIHILKKIIKNGQYDIIHQHASDSGILCNLILAKQQKVKKVIVHSHCERSNSHLMMHRVLKPLVSKFSDINIACSKEAGKWLFKKDFKVISNSVDIKKFQYNYKIREQLRKELNIDKNTIVIGHVGRFDPVKNHQFLLNVFKLYQEKNKNSKLVLVGDGPLFEHIKDYAKELNIENNTIFLGKRNDTHKIYNIFDVFLFPSFHEGLGICVIEALANGLTCISNEELPRIEDTIRLPLNEEIWYKKMKTLELQRKTYKNIKKYDTNIFIEEIENLYTK